MQTLAFLLLSVSLATADIRGDFIKYLERYLKEIGEKTETDDLKPCIEDPSGIIMITKKAVDDIRKMTDEGLAAGAYYLKGATCDLVKMLKKCSANREVLKKLEDVARKTTSEKIVEKLKAQKMAFYHLATSAFNAFSDNKFDTAGTNVGKITFMIFLTSGSGSPMKDFIIGFTDGIGESKNPEDLVKCARENDGLFARLKAAAYQLRSLVPATMVKGCQTVLDETKKVVGVLESCMEGYEKLKQLEKKLKDATAKKMVDIMKKKIMVFFHLSNDAIESLELKNYKSAGTAIGAIHKNLFLN